VTIQGARATTRAAEPDKAYLDNCLVGALAKGEFPEDELRAIYELIGLSHGARIGLVTSSVTLEEIRGVPEEHRAPHAAIYAFPREGADHRQGRPRPAPDGEPALPSPCLRRRRAPSPDHGPRDHSRHGQEKLERTERPEQPKNQHEEHVDDDERDEPSQHLRSSIPLYRSDRRSVRGGRRPIARKAPASCLAANALPTAAVGFRDG